MNSENGLLKDIEKNIAKEAKNREKILKEATSNLDSYSEKMIEYNNKIKECELLEIKYKNQQREMEEYISLYESKSQMYEEKIESLKKEVDSLKKKELKTKSSISNLKSIIESLIAHTSIEKIEEITGIEKEIIKKYLQD